MARGLTTVAVDPETLQLVEEFRTKAESKGAAIKRAIRAAQRCDASHPTGGAPPSQDHKVAGERPVTERRNRVRGEA